LLFRHITNSFTLKNAKIILLQLFWLPNIYAETDSHRCNKNDLIVQTLNDVILFPHPVPSPLMYVEKHDHPTLGSQNRQLAGQISCKLANWSGLVLLVHLK
jgi:hypothetical protein